MTLKRLSLMLVIALLTISFCTACGPALITAPPGATGQPAPGDSSTGVDDPFVDSGSNPNTTTDDQSTDGTLPEGLVAATVNGEPIYMADYERELGQYEASLLAQGIDPASAEGQQSLAQARTWILNVLIEQELTEQAAAAAGIEITDAEVDAYMQDMIDEVGGQETFEAQLASWGETYDDAWQEVRTQLIGMAMTQQVIDQVPTTAEHVHARHILVDTQQQADDIFAQIEAGADFAALAQAYSIDTSTQASGGDLGFFPRGVLIAPEVEEVAFALQPGQSQVVQSALGYHIVQVVERDPNRQISPENLRLLQDQAVESWVESLWAEANVQISVDTSL